jgi:hypothetical protein
VAVVEVAGDVPRQLDLPAYDAGDEVVERLHVDVEQLRVERSRGQRGEP